MRAHHATLSPVDVLIAEDDPLMRKSLRSLLEREGFRCAEAENGREAVELARRQPPQCVLLDLVMPELDGFAVARQLRADERTRGARIHCLTGRADADTREQAGEAGVEAFLTKPVDVERVLELLHRQVRRAEGGWVTGLTLAEARDLLDLLENQGCTHGEVACPDGLTFAVRCNCPAPPSPGAGGAGRPHLPSPWFATLSRMRAVFCRWVSGG